MERAMELTQAEVRHVAHLARLSLTDEEVAVYARQLSLILDFVRQLNQVDTAEAPAAAHLEQACNVLREDQPRQGCDTQAALTNAPDRQGAYFRVPKVLDSDD